jgi:hypothetical protein
MPVKVVSFFLYRPIDTMSDLLCAIVVPVIHPSTCCNCFPFNAGLRLFCNMVHLSVSYVTTNVWSSSFFVCTPFEIIAHSPIMVVIFFHYRCLCYIIFRMQRRLVFVTILPAKIFPHLIKSMAHCIPNQDGLEKFNMFKRVWKDETFRLVCAIFVKMCFPLFHYIEF